MGEKADSKSGLATFLTKLTAPLGVIGFITSVYNFAKLFTEKDVQLITWISLIVSILLLFGICLYYARFWKPESQDQSYSTLVLSATDQHVKQQAKQEQQRHLVRRSALAGLILIPLLTMGGFAGWQYVQNQPSKDVLILVADFEPKDLESHDVTGRIVKRLQEATESYLDVKVKPLDKLITDKQGSKFARKEGEKQKAAIVIWGWYNKIDDAIALSANFEMLKPPKYFPELGEEARGRVRPASMAEVKSFQLQTRLSNEMAYLTLVALGMSRYAVDDWDGAISRLTDALTQVKEPISAVGQSDIYHARAYSYYSKRNYDRAITDYTKAIELDPKNAGTYNSRGNVYLSKKDYYQAIADYTRAIQINRNWGRTNPNYFGLSTAYLNRSKAYAGKQDFDKAIADANQSLKLNPDYADAYLDKGSAYYYQKNYDRAISNYAQAIKLKPDYALVYYDRGLAYDQKGDLNQAISDYAQAIKLQPDYAEAYNNRGYAYYRKRNYDLAIEDYTKAIELNSKNAWAYGSRGYAQANKKNYGQAIEDYTKAIELNPKNAWTYGSRGVAYGEEKNYQKALADLNRALELEIDAANIYVSRGTVYRYMGNYEKALNDYNQAIKLDPKIDDSYLWRGIIYLEKNDKQSAVKDFKQVLQRTSDPEFKTRAGQELRILGAK